MAALRADRSLCHVQDDQGASPLHWIAMMGDADEALVPEDGTPTRSADGDHDGEPVLGASVREAIGLGCSVAARTSSGQTPLAWAASHGRVGALAALLDCGADVDAADENGVTALMLAAQQWKLATLLLLERGADPFVGDHRGCTAAHWAAHGDFRDGLAILHAMEARRMRRVDRLAAPPRLASSMLAHDAEGLLPIHRAIISGAARSVRWMVRAGGAGPLAVTRGAECMTALQLARGRAAAAAKSGRGRRHGETTHAITPEEQILQELEASGRSVAAPSKLPVKSFPWPWTRDSLTGSVGTTSPRAAHVPWVAALTVMAGFLWAASVASLAAASPVASEATAVVAMVAMVALAVVTLLWAAAQRHLAASRIGPSLSLGSVELVTLLSTKPDADQQHRWTSGDDEGDIETGAGTTLAEDMWKALRSLGPPAARDRAMSARALALTPLRAAFSSLDRHILEGFDHDCDLFGLAVARSNRGRFVALLLASVAAACGTIAASSLFLRDSLALEACGRYVHPWDCHIALADVGSLVDALQFSEVIAALAILVASAGCVWAAVTAAVQWALASEALTMREALRAESLPYLWKVELLANGAMVRVFRNPWRSSATTANAVRELSCSIPCAVETVPDSYFTWEDVCDIERDEAQRLAPILASASAAVAAAAAAADAAEPPSPLDSSSAWRAIREAQLDVCSLPVMRSSLPMIVREGVLRAACMTLVSLPMYALSWMLSCGSSSLRGRHSVSRRVHRDTD